MRGVGLTFHLRFLTLTRHAYLYAQSTDSKPNVPLRRVPQRGVDAVTHTKHPIHTHSTPIAAARTYPPPSPAPVRLDRNHRLTRARRGGNAFQRSSTCSTPGRKT